MSNEQSIHEQICDVIDAVKSDDTVDTDCYAEQISAILESAGVRLAMRAHCA